MTAQALFETCARAAIAVARGDRRVVARQELGVCIACGVPLAEHFDYIRNTFVPCGSHPGSPTDPAPQRAEPAAPRTPESAHQARVLVSVPRRHGQHGSRLDRTSGRAEISEQIRKGRAA